MQERSQMRRQQIDDKIARKQAHVQRLADKAYQTSIKTTMLGRDAQRQEYWHFKDDPARIYIRREEKITKEKIVESIEIEHESASGESPSPAMMHMPSGAEDAVMPNEVEVCETHISWYYYDTDVEVDTLLNQCLNPKGIRERALQTTMRTVRDRLKLKKGTLPQPKPVEAKVEEA